MGGRGGRSSTGRAAGRSMTGVDVRRAEATLDRDLSAVERRVLEAALDEGSGIDDAIDRVQAYAQRREGRAESRQVRDSIRSMRAPRAGERGQVFSANGRTVSISKTRPGWSSDGNKRARYAVRYDDGRVSNTDFFDGKGGLDRAKDFAISFLRIREV